MERGIRKGFLTTIETVYLIGRVGVSFACILLIPSLVPSGPMSAESRENGTSAFTVTVDTQPPSGPTATGSAVPTQGLVRGETQTVTGQVPSRSEARSTLLQQRLGFDGAPRARQMAQAQSPGTTPSQEGTLQRQGAPPPQGLTPQQQGSTAAQPVGVEQQSGRETQASQPAALSRSRAVASGTTGRGGMQGGPVSFNFDDADVYSVIQTVLGDLLRVNYVVDPKVKGRVTFRSVAPVPRDNVLPIMEVILRLNGIGIVEEAGLFRIIQITDIAKEPAPIQFGRDPEKVTVAGKSLLQVIPILNIQSTEIVKLISTFVSTNAVLIDVPRGNHIIVVDTDANVKRLLELVQIFDGDQFKNRKGEVHVYPVQNSKAKDVASLLQQIFLNASSSSTATPITTSRSASQVPGQGPAISPGATQTPVQPVPTVLGGGTGLVSDMTRIFSDEVINSVIIVGTPEDYAIIKEAIQKIDIIRRQVVLEGLIAEVTLIDNLSLGLAYSLKATINSIGLRGQVGLNPTTLSSADPTVFSGTGFNYMGVDDKGTVRAMVSALAAQSKGKLLAAPHILVADNREARIQVGQQVPIVTSETFASTTIAPQRTIQYKDIGIILKVKPQVNESGLVALEIDQEISSFSTQKLFTDSTEIIVDKTQATTNLVVGDGQTIVIGGLIREDSNKNESGIPFLHKIPVLGYLFGEKSRDTTRKELIILLTPHVIKTQEEARDVTNTYVDKFSDRGSIQREDLVNGGSKANKAGANGAK